MNADLLKSFTRLDKKMKRLLIATDSFVPRWDGVTRFLLNVIPSLKNKFDLTILAPDLSMSVEEIYVNYPQLKGVKIVLFKTFKHFRVGDFPPVIPPFFKIRNFIRDADIVWAQSVTPLGALSVYYGQRYGKEVIVYTHVIEWEIVPNAITGPKPFKWIVEKLVKMFTKYVLRKVDLLLVPFKELGEVYSRENITVLKSVVQLGTDINEFTPSLDKVKSKKEMNMPEDKIIIGYFGRIAREKDLTTLYRAYKNLAKKHKNLLLLLVGGGLTDKFKDKEGVLVVGSTNKGAKYLQAMDVYVMPSLTETTSLTTLEAMSCGLPVIATSVGLIKSYIKEGKNGFLFPKRNSYVLAKKLDWLIESSSMRENLGKNARKTVVDNFSWNKTISDLNKALDGF